MNSISTIIPVYQDSGLPFEILKGTVNSILEQTHPPIEIILSDDSSGTEVEDWVREFNKTSIWKVKYIKNPGPRGVSSNSNFATKHALGTLVHFLHSDDHLIGRDVYSKVIKAFEDTTCCWMLLSGRMKDIVTIPDLESLNLFGINSVGGPPAIVIARSIFEGFDENLSLLMDIEFFLRTLEKYGAPVVSNVVSIEYGVGDWQLTKTIDATKYCAEIDYLWKNQRLDFQDFTVLMAAKDSWNIKRRAFAYMTSSSELGKVNKLRSICLFKFKYSKLRIVLLTTSLRGKIFQRNRAV
jgi:glycosyltransferase involved in cell wall biosynthesis